MPKRKDSDRVQIGLRLREEMRSELEAAAKQHGISMNAEIASRLERSFWDEEVRQAELHNKFQGGYNYAIALALARIAGQISDQVFVPWPENEWTYQQVRQGFDTFLDAIAPPAGADKRSRFIQPLTDKGYGRKVAEDWLEVLPKIAAIRAEREAMGIIHLDPNNVREVAFQVAPEIVPLIGRKETKK